LEERETLIVEENIEALKSLSLTTVQSKIFLALAKSDYATIKGISELSKVPRQDIYRILAELQDLGLVEKTITKPVRFRTIGIEAASRILLERKREEYYKMKQERQKIVKTLSIQKTECSTQDDAFGISMLQGKIALSRTIRENLCKTKETVDFATTQKRLIQALQDLHLVVEKKLKEGVSFRVIIEKPKDEKAFSFNGGNILRNQNFKLMYSETPLKALVCIYDRKAAVAPIHLDGTWLKDPSVYTINPVFVAILQEYFNKLWNDNGRFEQKNGLNDILC
jgi:sugar-specific transcriptional regulator TrmB